jgi:YD repeat-containing protein
VSQSGGTNRTLTYDLNGNLVNDGSSRTFEWDAANRLVAVNYTGTTTRSEFTYDGLSRVVKVLEKNGANTTSTIKFVWCGTDLWKACAILFRGFDDLWKACAVLFRGSAVFRKGFIDLLKASAVLLRAFAYLFSASNDLWKACAVFFRASAYLFRGYDDLRKALAMLFNVSSVLRKGFDDLLKRSDNLRKAYAILFSASTVLRKGSAYLLGACEVFLRGVEIFPRANFFAILRNQIGRN